MMRFESSVRSTATGLCRRFFSSAAGEAKKPVAAGKAGAAAEARNPGAAGKPGAADAAVKPRGARNARSGERGPITETLKRMNRWSDLRFMCTLANTEVVKYVGIVSAKGESSEALSAGEAVTNRSTLPGFGKTRLNAYKYVYASPTLTGLLEAVVNCATPQVAGDVELARAALKNHIGKNLIDPADSCMMDTLMDVIVPDARLVEDAKQNKASLEMFLKDLMSRFKKQELKKKRKDRKARRPLPNLEKESQLIIQFKVPQKIAICVDSSFFGQSKKGNAIGPTSFAVYYADNFGVPLRLVIGSKLLSEQGKSDLDGFDLLIEDIKIEFPFRSFCAFTDSKNLYKSVIDRMRRLSQKERVLPDRYVKIAKFLLSNLSCIEYTPREEIPITDFASNLCGKLGISFEARDFP